MNVADATAVICAAHSADRLAAAILHAERVVLLVSWGYELQFAVDDSQSQKLKTSRTPRLASLPTT